jgi:predicted AAA+ superfamily ATPase
MLLRHYQERDELCDQISYWAPAEARSTEVDFVLTRGREQIAVEVKTARTARPEDLRGLRAIADLPGLARRVLVYLGNRSLRSEDGIEICPFEQFAEMLAEARL